MMNTISIEEQNNICVGNVWMAGADIVKSGNKGKYVYMRVSTAKNCKY